MYIVKLSENRHDSRYDGLPNLLDAYHEVETLEEALELRIKWIEEYPFLVKVNIFKADEIKIDDDIQEKARFKKDEYYKKVELLKTIGYDSYKEMDEQGKVTFQY